jgi:hypothetical protein
MIAVAPDLDGGFRPGLAVLRPVAVQPPVAEEEDNRAGDKAISDATRIMLVDRLQDELIGDGADQDAGGEGHDQANDAVAEGEPHRQHGTDDKRGGGEQSRGEGFEHAGVRSPLLRPDG